MRKLVRRSAERDDEGQIIKELQRGRRTMRLVRVTARQRSAPMAPCEADLSHAPILPPCVPAELEKRSPGPGCLAVGQRRDGWVGRSFLHQLPDTWDDLAAVQFDVGYEGLVG